MMDLKVPITREKGEASSDLAKGATRGIIFNSRRTINL
jgi:hypothetical protein